MKNKDKRGNWTSNAEQEMIDIEENERKHRINRCSFSDLRGQDRIENTHPDGICMDCDWHRDMHGKSWDDPSFIEAWDYPEYWLRHKKKPNALVTQADIEPK